MEVLSHQGRELGAPLRALWKVFVGLAVLSGVINVLLLTGSLYMLEVYDRVLPSKSLSTLAALSGLALILFLFFGLLDCIRMRVLSRIGGVFEATVAPRVYDALIHAALRNGENPDLLRDLDQIKNFASGAGPIALFDLPWVPFYVLICYLFHPWIGLFVLFGAAFLVSLTLIAELFTKARVASVSELALRRANIAEDGRRNASVAKALGMIPAIRASWEVANTNYLRVTQRAADTAAGFGAISKVSRMIIQSATLGIGGFLVIQGEATAGVIIASSIISARALSPLDTIIANWKNFLLAQQSWRRLSAFLTLIPVQRQRTLHPRPTQRLTVEGVSVAPPGSATIVADSVSFELLAGRGLAILGPNASGKSSLAKAIVGVWPTLRGKIRLDGVALDDWNAEDLAREIGYLPQNAELLAGTIGQNISRFDPNADAATIIAAANLADVHQLILQLPQAYETKVGEGGSILSAGQKQRVALARALYGDPFLLVLDEPDANLDSGGIDALNHSIMNFRNRGRVVIVIAHSIEAVAKLDTAVLMIKGTMQAVGRPAEILKKMKSPRMSAGYRDISASWAVPVRVVANTKGSSAP